MKAAVFIEQYVLSLKQKIAKLENKVQQEDCEDCPYLEHGYVCECEHAMPSIKKLDKLKSELSKFERYAK